MSHIPLGYKHSFLFLTVHCHDCFWESKQIGFWLPFEFRVAILKDWLLTKAREPICPTVLPKFIT